MGVCGAPCGHVRSASGVGSFLCDEVGFTLLALAVLVSPDLCLCFLEQDECHAGDPRAPRRV